LMHRLSYARCFRLEGEFAAGMAHVFARIGLAGAAMERILATEKNVSPREPAPVYTSELAARVYRLYVRDFELFGYDEPSWRGL
jgi:hypothetical protein